MTETRTPRRIIAYSDDETAKQRRAREELEQAEKRHRDSLTPFQIGFGRILTASEMTACDTLSNALSIIEIAGNASMSYDGAGVDNLSYGSKTITDRVVRASDYRRQCQRAIVADVQMIHHDAWRMFTLALIHQLNVAQTGEMICRLRKDKKNEKDRRRLATGIVQKSAQAIQNISY